MRLISIFIWISYTSTSGVVVAMMYSKPSSIGFREYTHSSSNNFGYPQPFTLPDPVIPTLKNPDNPVLIPLSHAGFKPVIPSFGYRGNRFNEERTQYPYGNSNEYHDSIRQPSMPYLPLFLGGEQGRELAAYNMMMTASGNSMFPFFPINNVENVGLLPMVNFANGGEMGTQDLNPFVMSAFFEFEL